ncbi:ATPase, T2SS/T4P/T4SS family [Microvenator marinus]|nr:ATPase, T2SS/T4P/T4SS family [Microvenator marinus]
MTFEEAAEFLNTSRSTLYRWLREERVPAHKMGRQWRFLRDELEAFSRGDVPMNNLSELAKLLRDRNQEEDEMQMTHPSEISNGLIWDALDHGASVIHIDPKGSSHQVRYRTDKGLETLFELPALTFESLDSEWTKSSKPVRGDLKRRLFLERDQKGKTDRVQVRYQKLETLAGSRVVLRLLPENTFAMEVDVIAPEAEDAQTLRKWMNATHGLVLISGRSGSGKTTTAYVCLNELAQAKDKVIFTIEDPIGTYIPDVNQLEVDLNDERAYREAFSAVFDSDVDVLFISSTIASRHRQTMWRSALSAAESGHLVFVQMEADSAEDAVARMRAEVDGPLDDVLVGAVWQELVEKKGGGRKARYEFFEGPSR